MQFLQFLCSNVKSYENQKAIQILNGFLINIYIINPIFQEAAPYGYSYQPNGTEQLLLRIQDLVP